MSDNVFEAVVGIGLLVGTYMWGKNKGHQKATFENEIDKLKKELKDLKEKKLPYNIIE